MIKFRLNCYYRARADEAVAERHAEVSAAMKSKDSSLGWANLIVPDAPDFGRNLVAGYHVKFNKQRKIMCTASYSYRDADHLSDDKAGNDDKLFYEFASCPPSPEYERLLKHDIIDVVESFRAYRVVANFYLYSVKYSMAHEELYEKLRTDPAIDTDGRNNIFTLNVVQYWDAELCHKALGYGPDEVIRRLTGKVPLVRPLMDGVYTVFNDDPNLSFEEFCAYNDQLKPVLGLV